jgi:hypothetical protein
MSAHKLAAHHPSPQSHHTSPQTYQTTLKRRSLTEAGNRAETETRVIIGSQSTLTLEWDGYPAVSLVIVVCWYSISVSGNFCPPHPPPPPSCFIYHFTKLIISPFHMSAQKLPAPPPASPQSHPTSPQTYQPYKKRRLLTETGNRTQTVTLLKIGNQSTLSLDVEGRL